MVFRVQGIKLRVGRELPGGQIPELRPLDEAQEGVVERRIGADRLPHHVLPDAAEPPQVDGKAVDPYGCSESRTLQER